MKHTRMVLLMAILMLALCASVSWGAIGVYKWTATATVPSTIGYMLNLDADDVSGTWSVKVEVVPAAGGAAVKTYSYLYPDAMCTRGSHSVVWDGTKDDSTAAPVGQYKAVITAKAAPVTGTNLVGKFTNSPDTYYAVDVNKNPDSPYFGYIYVCVWRQGIAMFAPDGSGYYKTNCGISWPAASCPWGLAVDDSGSVYLGARSGAGVIGHNFIFTPDLSTRIGDSVHLDNDRAVDVFGPTTNVYLADTSSVTTSAAGTYGRISSLHGDATTWSTATPPATFEWKSAVGTLDRSWCHQQTKIWDEGNANGPVIYAPSWRGFATSTTFNSGALCKYVWNWTTGQPIPDPATPAIPETWVNPNLTLGLAVDISPDGTTMGMTRDVTGGTTATPVDCFVTFPVASASTITSTDANYKKYGFVPPPGGFTPGTSQYRMQFFRYDALGNVLANYGSSNREAQQGYWGFFAPPDNGSTNTRTTGVIGWMYPQPAITSTNSPVSISSCQAGATATGTVNVSCADGIDKVSSVTVDFAPLQKAGQGVVTLSGGGTGNTGSWSATFGVNSGLRVGDYNCPIKVYSTHSELSPTEGTLVVRVTGATITGQLTNSQTGWPIANATVAATTGTPPDFTTTTDASGNYTLRVNPGSYAVSASRAGYGAQAGGAVSMTLTCGQDKTQNLQLDPMDIYAATQGNWYSSSGPGVGTVLCVVGSVSRLPQQGTGHGFNGYYYISDRVHNNVQSGVRINNIAGQPTLKEGDFVCVEGTWNSPSGVPQCQITPTRVPQVVGTGTQVIPDEFFASYRANVDHPYGALYHVYGTVSDSQFAGVVPFGPYFMISCPTSPTDPTPVNIRVRVDTPATSGLATQAAWDAVIKNGTLVHVNGVLSLLDTWQTDVLSVGKAEDIYLISDNVASIAAAKALADGTKVGYVKAQATVVGSNFVYIESADRTAGLRIEGTMPTGLGTIGTGDLLDFHGTMATSAQGERFVTTDLLQRNTLNGTASARPLEAIGMNNRNAAEANSLGLFVKTWGKVTAKDADSFTITDGSAAAVKVICGSTMEKPDVNQTVRVRGVASKDASGPVVYMRNERVDWTTGDAAYQPLPFPGAYGYARDFLVVGPFADAESANADAAVAREYRLQHDFISDATGGAFTELTIASMNPKLGGPVGTKTWTRSQATGDNAQFASATPAADQTNCTFYAHIWVYSPIQGDYVMRIGSDDSAKIFVTGYLGTGYEAYVTTPAIGRGESYGQDTAIWVPIAAGWNSVLIKCENGTGPSGVDVQFVDQMNQGAPGWGNALSVPGLGYLLDKP